MRTGKALDDLGEVTGGMSGAGSVNTDPDAGEEARHHAVEFFALGQRVDGDR